MRYFHVALIGLLTIIAIELGIVTMKLPTPAAQAQSQPRSIPTPGPLQDPHDLIRAQLAQIQRALVLERQRVDQELSAISQDVGGGRMHRIEEYACLAYSNARNVNLKVNPGLNGPNTRPFGCPPIP